MGFPPYEAAIYNTVTIASNVTAIPEIYGDTVYYVDPLNIEQIAFALKQFSEGGIDKTIYQKRFPLLLQKFTWENTARAIHHLIEH
jgi:glycosyltransferase involved in cell wall biosynthesis